MLAKFKSKEAIDSYSKRYQATNPTKQESAVTYDDLDVIWSVEDSNLPDGHSLFPVPSHPPVMIALGFVSEEILAECFVVIS